MKSAEWITAVADDSFVTPETLTDEQRLIAKTAAEFVEGEVAPALPRLEAKDWGVARRLVHRAGELGLLGVTVPERWGGVDADTVSSLIVSEQLGRIPSFGATTGAQANLCIAPVLMFGTDEQRARYLSPLVRGELIGAYALSESGAGSDALSARTLATSLGDGGYSVTGEKLWITNGGFADLFVVFAKVDGAQFTAFLVEREFGGVANGSEEHKMGLHGSSTTPLVLSDVRVPCGNILGEVGKGHRVAFTILNFGRFKLGAMCAGSCKQALTEAARYAVSRRQFDRPIASFGAVRHKLGEMIARTYALEAVLYRTAGLIDSRAGATDDSIPIRGTIEAIAIEASIAKVLGSETLDYVVDENVQIHGGNGFVRDYPAERRYRDARVNRIFEGTNEINRLLLAGRVLKRAAARELPLLDEAVKLRTDLMGTMSTAPTAAAVLGDEQDAMAAFRRVGIMIAALALERYGRAVEDEQEVLLWIADILIETFAADSSIRRARQAHAIGHPLAALHADAAAVYVAGAALRVECAAREALASMSDGDQRRTNLAALRRALKVNPTNTVARRRTLADCATAAGRYPFE
jgi:alkylation response protein AidB-like acyl-CoA dehydrogenase